MPNLEQAPFYDAGRLCTSEGTLLPDGRRTSFIAWQARMIPTLMTQESIRDLVKEALPGAKIKLVPAVDAGISIVIDDDGVEKVIPMHDLTDAYLAAGSPAAAAKAAVRALVRKTVGYTD